MKRVLIITYYWPPTGGSGVQRWLKFSKYLPEYGWQPVIYTPSNPEAIVSDPSLEKEISPDWEIIKKPIWEPYDLYRKLTGKKKGEAQKVNPISDTSDRSFKARLSLWIRANLFIPDPRASWIRPSVKFLKQYLKEHPVDLIVSTGPPQSMHLLARNLKRETGLRWLADFRDPWTKIFYFKHLPLMSWARSLHGRMEASVIREADEVVTVTRQFKEGFLHLCDSEKAQHHFHIIPNGYDEEDLIESSREDALETEGKFCLTHTGLFSAEGNPSRLWEVLDELCRESDQFRNHLRIRLIGKTDPQILEEIRSKDSLAKAELIDMGYLPHSEICRWQKIASVLLLPLRKEPESAGILAGKFFEYLASGNPILGFGPEEGALEDALSQTGSGRIYDWDEKERLKTYLRELYSEYGKALKAMPVAVEQKFTAADTASPDNVHREMRVRREETVQQFSRRNLTAEIVKIFNQEK